MEDLIEHMNINVSTLERCNQEWVALLKDLKGEGKAAEEKEHSRAANGTEGYVEILLNAGELVARLWARLARISRRMVKKSHFLILG